MPRFDAHLHYRMIDVSSIKELCRRWYPRAYFGQPPKGLAHRALADIHESIRELEYYRRTVFVPPPGPDVDTAKAIGLMVAGDHPIPVILGRNGVARMGGSGRRESCFDRSAGARYHGRARLTRWWL